ncbi:MAG: hypothetical protein M3Q00_07630 [Pseudomonadota bacterium]|nr:hypothetical protein [Pseudomonadota bacterium]
MGPEGVDRKAPPRSQGWFPWRAAQRSERPLQDPTRMGWGLPGGRLCCDSLMWNNHTGIKASRLPPGKLQRDRDGLDQRFPKGGAVITAR